MKAIELQDYGGPDALHLVDVDRPVAAVGQLLVRVAANSVNPLDIARASGALKAIFPLDFPFVPGGDFSGTVAVVGDAVYGYDEAGGAYAEYKAVDAANVSARPAGLSHAEAASIALVGRTAMQAVDAAQLTDGQTLLVTGMGGAIGTIIAQLLRGRNVRVIGLASARDRDRLLSGGVAQVVDQLDGLDGTVDAVIDAVGGEVQAQCWTLLGAGGVLVTLNQPPSQDEAERRGVHALMLHTDTSTGSLDRLREAIKAGTVTPRVGARYALAASGDAWANVSSDRADGKTVIVVDVSMDD